MDLKLLIMFFILSLLLLGCQSNYDGSIDKGPVQIGARYIITHNIDKSNTKESETPSERVSNFRLGLPWWLDDTKGKTKINGLIISTLLDWDAGTLNGVAISPICAKDKVNGLVIAPLFTMNREMNGISLSCWNWSVNKAIMQVGLINFCEFLNAPGEVQAQIGILNEAGRASFQCGVVNNGWISPWLQLGLFNTVMKPDKFNDDGDKRSAVQIGLYNYAQEGFQLGFINRNENGLLKWSFLLNF